eukprot:scaffold12335_cov96-Isochrysis_galbana.AAC.2
MSVAATCCPGRVCAGPPSPRRARAILCLRPPHPTPPTLALSLLLFYPSRSPLPAQSACLLRQGVPPTVPPLPLMYSSGPLDRVPPPFDS